MVNKKSIHFVLTKSKDADLLAWKNLLKDGSFNRTVNEILIAESEKKIATIPCGSKKIENPQTINSRLVVYDRYAIELIESFDAKEVTSSIKKIIRKHLTKNRQAVKPSKDDRYKLISEILNSFEEKMCEKEQEYSGVSNKYQKLCDSYDIAIKNLFDKLLSCASAPTTNEACNKLRNFNYIEIINDAYKTAFDVLPAVEGKKDQSTIPLSEETKPNLAKEEKSNTVSGSVGHSQESKKKIVMEQTNKENPSETDLSKHMETSSVPSKKDEEDTEPSAFYKRMLAMSKRS